MRGEHAVAAEERDLDAGVLELLAERAGLGVLAAVVDEVGAGVLILVTTAEKSLVAGVDVVGADDLAAELGELLVEECGEAGAVGLLVVDDEDVLLLELLKAYSAAKAPCRASVVAVRKYVLYGALLVPSSSSCPG